MSRSVFCGQSRTGSVPQILVRGVPNSAGPVTAVVLELGGRGTDFLNPEVSRARGVFLWIWLVKAARATFPPEVALASSPGLTGLENGREGKKRWSALS